MSKTAVTPDYRTMNLDIFRNPEGGPVIFQPRLDFCIAEKRRLGTLPEAYREMEILEIHDDIGCSYRPYKIFNRCISTYDPVTGARKWKYDVPVEEKVVEGSVASGEYVMSEVYKTPHGDLETLTRYKEKSRHVEQFPVRCPEDLRALEYVLESQIFEFDDAFFKREDERLGNRGAPQLFMSRVNIMQLMVTWTGMEGFVFLTMSAPDKAQHIVDVIDRKEEDLLRILAECPIRIVNYGDNIDCNLCPPTYLMQYVKPQYERRYEILRKSAGKFVHSHFDGAVKPLLKYFKEMPLDGLEALTPKPQGDATIEELREAVPERFVVLDVTPMVHFLPHHPVADLDAAVEKIIDLFAPRLVLGVSDEISPVCEIDRIKRVADYVRNLQN